MTENTSDLPIVGGIIAALGAGLCCAGPFVVLLLGISGSWIGNLSLFEPYRPIFFLAVFILFYLAGLAGKFIAQWATVTPVQLVLFHRFVSADKSFSS